MRSSLRDFRVSENTCRQVLHHPHKIMSKPNEFFDITQLPQEKGLLVFPVSLSKIAGSQSPDECISYLEHFYEKIDRTEGIGVVFVYSDYLYLLTPKDDPANTRDRYLNQMAQHRQGILGRIHQTPMVRQVFSFYSFGQIVIKNPNLLYKTNQALEKYQEDEKLQGYVEDDSEGQELDDRQVQFILEESVFFYCLAKGALSFNSDFIDTPEWMLQCYPGPSLKTETYMLQEDYLNVETSENKFADNYYDLKVELLYEYSKIDMDNFPEHR